MSKSQTDDEQELIWLLQTEPQEAMTRIVGRYTGLIWTVAGQYLADPEDRKDCVSDTFTEFYRCRGRFNPSKGSLTAFLGTIARRQAIDLYRKNQRFRTGCPNEEPAVSGKAFQQTDLRVDLEQAIASLKPEDAEIIRMKYYGGMTIREIADSLQLPYETVKKRHQRGLGKMRLALLVLLLILLAVSLSACAYLLLRHFGVIPGVGVNHSGDMAFYILEEPVSAETQDVKIRLESGVLSSDSLVLTLVIEKNEENEETENPEDVQPEPNFTLLLEDGSVYPDILMNSHRDLESETAGKSLKQQQLIYETGPALLTESGVICLTLNREDIRIPFSLTAAREDPLSDYHYALAEYGGLLAIPCLEEGRLYVDLYPLSSGGYRTEPSLIRGLYETAGGPQGFVTMTASDGTVHTGTCLAYHPRSSDAFFRWDFGPADPGDYVLDIPYLYQSADLPEDFSIVVSDEDPGIGQTQNLTGCVLTVKSYSSQQPEGSEYHHFPPDYESPALLRFLCYDVEMENNDRILVGLEAGQKVETANDGQPHVFFSSELTMEQDGNIHFLGTVFNMPEGYEKGPVEIHPEPLSHSAFYRWNHPFSLSLHVEAEEEKNIEK